MAVIYGGEGLVKCAAPTAQTFVLTAGLVSRSSNYSDLSMSVQQAYNDMKRMLIVDSKSLISYINVVENYYRQLGEVQQLTSITMSHIDDLCDKLPLSIRKDWMREYSTLVGMDKIHPFTHFMRF